jgi:3-oxoacyl-[acyl-carrier-protein] synthase III
MTFVGISALGSYLPGPPITIDDLGYSDDPMAKSPLFRPPHTRHHVKPGERSAEMAANAAIKAVVGHDIAVIITNTLLPDNPITGCGSEVASLLGLHPRLIIDLHNGGCAAFPYSISILEELLRAGESALVCSMQSGAGQVFRQRNGKMSSRIATQGDGCGIAIVTNGAGARLIATHVIHEAGASKDMGLSMKDRSYWEAGVDQFDISFSAEAFKDILSRGNSLVPEVIREVCSRGGFKTEDIDLLVTNQPNRQFLREWHSSLGIDPEIHTDTFDEFGNLYGAGIPVTLHKALTAGKIKNGALVVIGGFAHAGDLAAAAAFRWNAAVSCGD